MPWHIAKRDGKFAVVKDSDNKTVPGGAHTTRKQALRHMAALYAAEPQAAKESLSAEMMEALAEALYGRID